MTVRDFIQTILLESPNLDAEIYVQIINNENDIHDFVIDKITSCGSNDALFIEIEDWKKAAN